ncbi:hypothetical protein CVT24_005344 [Panaeolus cyanescens]|uniref:Vta1/callose synthase N-terminal domain-containing protein n=1 Tax=Panaeolus cyanescens TaxID=181874 RepID=A0A409Y8Z7_9AGAR|nr:hypothetical protein CVT24_005344 [Panaeolus cyanescens]
MASTSLLGLPPIPTELKPIVPFLQRAQEIKKQDPIIAYWCAYYAAQVGISLKARDAASRDVLLGLLGTLESMKSEIGANDAIDMEAVSSAYVENFALKVFASADNEDRAGRASKATAKKFLAAANFLEILKTFPKKDVADSNEEKIKYAKWKAADIAKAFREGRKPAPGPPGWSEDQELRQLQAEVRAEEATDGMFPYVPHIPSVPSQAPSSYSASSSPPRSSPQNIPRPHAKWTEEGDGPSETWSTAATPGLSEAPSTDFGSVPPSAGSIRSSHSRGSSTGSTSTIGSRGMAVDPKSGSPPKSAIKSSSGSPDSDKRVHWSDPSSPAPPPSFIPPQAPSSSPPGEYLGPQSIYGPPQPNVPLPPPVPPHPPTHHSTSTTSPVFVNPIPPVQPSPPRGPPVYGNPVAPQPTVPFELTPSIISKVQKHCRFAISSLDYEDAEQARRELRAALALLEQ